MTALVCRTKNAVNQQRGNRTVGCLIQMRITLISRGRRSALPTPHTRELAGAQTDRTSTRLTRRDTASR